MKKAFVIGLVLAISLGYCHGFDVEKAYARSDAGHAGCPQCFKDGSQNRDTSDGCSCCFTQDANGRTPAVYFSAPLKIKTLGNVSAVRVICDHFVVLSPPFLRINSPPSHISILKTVQQLE